MHVILELADERATMRLAARLAAEARAGDVIALHGPLGSGKTTLARGFIRAVGGVEVEVPSPTFTLVETYAVPGKPAIWHFDLYRLDDAEEAYELGIEDAFAEGISLIEWPERIAALLPRERLQITLAPGDAPRRRVATLDASPRWRHVVEGLRHG
ncbi:MAG: tRNA (adenosine(37)-N6)-threonylcarbamoyltransferase complex ATPase subunit type 1 TsaE [Stellaceae bacterium]